MKKNGFENLHAVSSENCEKERQACHSVSRRTFLTTALAFGGAFVAAKASTAPLEINPPVPTGPRVSPARNIPIVPPGARSLASYSSHCTGCQLCVAACPHQVLRMAGAGMGMLQPVLSFEHGACRHGCVACSLVCPTGAILPLTVRVKNTTQIGRARLIPDLCIAATEKTPCTECARNCPTGAIMLIDSEGARIPRVDEERCTGCGSCEFHCPVRPRSAMLVEGNSVHMRV